MPKGPLGGPRPLVGSRLRVTLLLKEKATDKQMDKIKRLASDDINAPITDIRRDEFKGEPNVIVNIEDKSHKTLLVGVPEDDIHKFKEDATEEQGLASNIVLVAISSD